VPCGVSCVGCYVDHCGYGSGHSRECRATARVLPFSSEAYGTGARYFALTHMRNNETPTNQDQTCTRVRCVCVRWFVCVCGVWCVCVVRVIEISQMRERAQMSRAKPGLGGTTASSAAVSLLLAQVLCDWSVSEAAQLKDTIRTEVRTTPPVAHMHTHTRTRTRTHTHHMHSLAEASSPRNKTRCG
jgi:hypothetical protein